MQFSAERPPVDYNKSTHVHSQMNDRGSLTVLNQQSTIIVIGNMQRSLAMTLGEYHRSSCSQLPVRFAILLEHSYINEGCSGAFWLLPSDAGFMSQPSSSHESAHESAQPSSSTALRTTLLDAALLDTSGTIGGGSSPC